MNNIAELFTTYRRRLLAFIRNRVPEDEAEDIVQDVFLRLIQAEKTTSVAEVSAWLYRVARNSMIDRSRKQREKRMPQTALQRDDEVFTREITEILIEEDQSPEKELVRNLVWVELEKALSELPAEQRWVFERTELDGMSYKALSAETGVAVETLLSRKHYAVKYLRQQLKEVYEALLDEE